MEEREGERREWGGGGEGGERRERRERQEWGERRVGVVEGGGGRGRTNKQMNPTEKTGMKRCPAPSCMDAGDTAQVALGKEGLYLWLPLPGLSALPAMKRMVTLPLCKAPCYHCLHLSHTILVDMQRPTARVKCLDGAS